MPTRSSSSLSRTTPIGHVVNAGLAEPDWLTEIIECSARQMRDRLDRGHRLRTADLAPDLHPLATTERQTRFRIREGAAMAHPRSTDRRDRRTHHHVDLEQIVAVVVGVRAPLSAVEAALGMIEAHGHRTIASDATYKADKPTHHVGFLSR